MYDVKQKTKQNELLRNARLQRGWSQADVAAKIGSDPKTVGRWERGLTFPSLYLRQQLCSLFEQDAASLGIIRQEPTEILEETLPANTPPGTEIQHLASSTTLPITPSQNALLFPEAGRARLLNRFVPSLSGSMALILLFLFVISQIAVSDTLFRTNTPNPTQSPSTIKTLFHTEDPFQEKYTQYGYQWLINDALNSTQSAGQLHTVPEGQCF